MPTTSMETNELVWAKPASKLLPGQVRALLKAFLRERETALHLELPDDFISDVILAAAELTNNAVAHTPSGERVTFRARIEEARSLWAGVWDCSPETPVAKPMIGPDGMPMLDECGRGLGITLALAAELNVTWHHPQGNGRGPDSPSEPHTCPLRAPKARAFTHRNLVPTTTLRDLLHHHNLNQREANRTTTGTGPPTRIGWAQPCSHPSQKKSDESATPAP